MKKKLMINWVRPYIFDPMIQFFDKHYGELIEIDDIEGLYNYIMTVYLDNPNLVESNCTPYMILTMEEKIKLYKYGVEDLLSMLNEIDIYHVSDLALRNIVDMTDLVMFNYHDQQFGSDVLKLSMKYDLFLLEKDSVYPKKIYLYDDFYKNLDEQDRDKLKILRLFLLSLRKQFSSMNSNGEF